MEKRLKQDFPDQILADDLEYLEVKLNKRLFIRLIALITNIAPNIGFDYKDLMISFGFMDSGRTDEEIKLASEFLKLSSDEIEDYKLQYPDYDFEKIEEISKEMIERGQRIATLPKKLITYIVNSGMEKEFNELYNILSAATCQSVELLEETELWIIIELFAKMVIKPKKDMQKALFLNPVWEMLKANFPLLNFIGKASLTSSKRN